MTKQERDERMTGIRNRLLEEMTTGKYANELGLTLTPDALALLRYIYAGETGHYFKERNLNANNVFQKVLALEEQLAQADARGQREYLRGKYDMCRLLLTSPRMQKPQREIIEEQVYKVLDRLKALDSPLPETQEGAQ